MICWLKQNRITKQIQTISTTSSGWGRRTAYLGLYKKAIKIFSKGLKKHPDSPELYRHRGHRYISIRQFDKAIRDFQKAATLAEGRDIEIEPDGLPNKLNIPLSNLQFNIYYHWALAHYLKGAFEKAIPIYEKCMAYSDNDDLITATADWMYMTYRRLGQEDKAQQVLAKIHSDMKIIENDAYYKRLLMYKGEIKPSDLLDLENDDPDELLNLVTQGYGVGNWYFYNGEKGKALEIFRKIVGTDYWSAFGYIAAEADLFGR
jgi:tetratricopeptide (TPR) repeat protein